MAFAKGKHSDSFVFFIIIILLTNLIETLFVFYGECAKYFILIPAIQFGV